MVFDEHVAHSVLGHGRLDLLLVGQFGRRIQVERQLIQDSEIKRGQSHGPLSLHACTLFFCCSPQLRLNQFAGRRGHVTPPMVVFGHQDGVVLTV